MLYISLFNEIYTPVFEKKKFVKPYQRSVLQLLTVLQNDNKGLLNTFKDHKDFACPMTIKQQIEQEYNSKMMKIDPEDLCAEAKKYSLGQKRAFKIDVADSMIAKKT